MAVNVLQLAQLPQDVAVAVRAGMCFGSWLSFQVCTALCMHIGQLLCCVCGGPECMMPGQQTDNRFMSKTHQGITQAILFLQAVCNLAAKSVPVYLQAQ